MNKYYFAIRFKCEKKIFFKNEITKDDYYKLVYILFKNEKTRYQDSLFYSIYSFSINDLIFGLILEKGGYNYEKKSK